MGRLKRRERLGGGGPAEDPPGPVVELLGDGVDIVLGDADRSAFLCRYWP